MQENLVLNIFVAINTGRGQLLTDLSRNVLPVVQSERQPKSDVKEKCSSQNTVDRKKNGWFTFFYYTDNKSVGDKNLWKTDGTTCI